MGGRDKVAVRQPWESGVTPLQQGGVHHPFFLPIVCLASMPLIEVIEDDQSSLGPGPGSSTELLRSLTDLVKRLDLPEDLIPVFTYQRECEDPPQFSDG